MKRIFWIVAALVLVSCSSGLDKKLDGSNEKAFATSLEKMKESAKPEEIKQLDEALLVLAISDVDIGYQGGIVGALAKISKFKTPEQLASDLMPVVNGKTGRELIAEGHKRKKDEAQRQLAGAEQEITQLKKMRDEKDTARGVLEKIEVLEPDIHFSGMGAQKLALLDFKIHNGTETPLTYLFLRGSVIMPVSKKVLFSDDINYKLTDPIPPGDTKQIRLPNSAPGKWNAPEIWGRSDVALAIEIVNAETGEGQKLAASFTHKDAERLALLEKLKPELEKLLQEK